MCSSNNAKSTDIGSDPVDISPVIELKLAQLNGVIAPVLAASANVLCHECSRRFAC